MRAICLLLALAGACGSSPEQPEPDGLFIIGGIGQSDSAGATLPQLLEVKAVLGGITERGTPVHFEATSPGIQMAPVAGAFDVLVVVPTDGSGIARVQLRLGPEAGTASVRISSPDIENAVSTSFEVRAAQPYAITVVPQDTMVVVGESFLSRSRVADRFGNQLDVPVTLVEPTDHLTVSAGRITANAPGRGSVLTRSGAITASHRVLVSPLAHVSGLRLDTLVLLDGNALGASIVPVALPGVPFTADWSPAGTFLIADSQTGGPLRVIRPDGSSQFLRPNLGFAWDIYPEVSADGQWIYYARHDGNWHIRRTRPDGTGDEAIPGLGVDLVAPSLAPDGKRLAVVRVGVPDRLEIFDLEARTLHEVAASAHTPAWSPDGAFIAFVNSTTQTVEVIRPDGSGRKVVGPAGAINLGIDWNPIGMFIVGALFAGGGLVAIDPLSGTWTIYSREGLLAAAARGQ